MRMRTACARRARGVRTLRDALGALLQLGNMLMGEQILGLSDTEIGLMNVAVRVPAHPVAQALLALVR